LPEIAKPLLPLASQPEIQNPTLAPKTATQHNLFANANPLQNSTSNLQTSAAAPALDNLTPIERATLSEVKRRVQDGDEVILIVRSRRNSEIPSDVIVLNNTSEQFLDNLTKQSPTQHNQQTENPHPNQIILSSHGTQEPQPRPVTFNVLHNK
jgi:hypothetical protein